MSATARSGPVGGTHLFECTKFNRLRQDILWQGTGTWNMTEILGTPNLAKRAASFMSSTGLFASLEGHA